VDPEKRDCIPPVCEKEAGGEPKGEKDADLEPKAENSRMADKSEAQVQGE